MAMRRLSIIRRRSIREALQTPKPGEFFLGENGDDAPTRGTPMGKARALRLSWTARLITFLSNCAPSAEPTTSKQPRHPGESRLRQQRAW